MPRCSFVKSNRERCKAFSLIDDQDGYCLFHSRSDRAKRVRAKREIISKEQMILTLQKELRKVRRVKDDIVRAGEVRRLIELISELKGDKPHQPEEKKNTFNEIVDQCLKKKEHSQS